MNEELLLFFIILSFLAISRVVKPDKAFLSNKASFESYKKFSNLNINVATPEYMLAMKCLSARVDNENEIDDLKFLINKLNLKTIEDVEQVISKFYPIEKFMVKTEYIIREILDNEQS